MHRGGVKEGRGGREGGGVTHFFNFLRLGASTLRVGFPCLMYSLLQHIRLLM